MIQQKTCLIFIQKVKVMINFIFHIVRSLQNHTSFRLSSPSRNLQHNMLHKYVHEQKIRPSSNINEAKTTFQFENEKNNKFRNYNSLLCHFCNYTRSFLKRAHKTNVNSIKTSIGRILHSSFQLPNPTQNPRPFVLSIRVSRWPFIDFCFAPGIASAVIRQTNKEINLMIVLFAMNVCSDCGLECCVFLKLAKLKVQTWRIHV